MMNVCPPNQEHPGGIFSEIRRGKIRSGLGRLEAQFRSADDVVLQLLGQFYEVSGVASDTDQQVLVICGIFLGSQQRVLADHGELTVHTLALYVGLQQVDQVVPAHIAFQSGGGELPVQQRAVAGLAVVDLGDGLADGCGPLNVVGAAQGVGGAQAVGDGFPSSYDLPRKRPGSCPEQR